MKNAPQATSPAPLAPDVPAEVRAALDHPEHAEFHGIAALDPKHTRNILRRAKGVQWLLDHGLASDWPPPRPVKQRESAPLSLGNPPRRGLKIVNAGERPQAPPAARPALVRADQVVAVKQEWLWPGRFPRGAVSLIAGNMGVGKSTFISYLVAAVTSGGKWPDGGAVQKPASVVYIQDEESRGAMVRPRLERFGADLARVGFLTGVFRGDSDVELGFSIARDVDALEAACDQLGEVGLVLIDPIGSYLTGISGYSESETREAVGPLFRFAERRDVAVVCVAHLNKDADKSIQNRISGTFALPAKGRMVWYLSQDPGNRRRRLLSLLKGNLDGKTETALAFGYSGDRIAFSSRPVPLDACQIDNLLRQKAMDERMGLRTGGEKKSKLPAAKAFIATVLEAGPVASAALLKKAAECGVRESTYRKALAQLVDEKRVVEEGDPPAMKLLPPEQAELPLKHVSEPPQAENVKNPPL